MISTGQRFHSTGDNRTAVPLFPSPRKEEGENRFPR